MVGGIFSGTVDFDPGPATVERSASGDRDAFVMSLDQEGTIEWVRTFGATGSDSLSAIAIGADGTIVATGAVARPRDDDHTGSANQRVDLDPTDGVDEHPLRGMDDVYVICLDHDGAFQWARSFGGPFREEGDDISISESGAITVIGEFIETVDFDPGPGVQERTAEAEADVFVVRLDTEGRFVWVQLLLGDSRAEAASITAGPEGSAVISGYFSDTLDFDPGEQSVQHRSEGMPDGFIVSLDELGRHRWVQTIRCEDGAIVEDVAQASTAEVYATGAIFGLAEFGHGDDEVPRSSRAQGDVFVAAFSADGDLRWARVFPGTGEDTGETATILAQGNLLIATGYFEKRIEFGEGQGAERFRSLRGASFMVWISKEGDHRRSAIWEGVRIRDITADGDGSLVIVGSLTGSADLDPGEASLDQASRGDRDAFILRLQGEPSATSP